jgi:hypothetical protein
MTDIEICSVYHIRLNMENLEADDMEEDQSDAPSTDADKSAGSGQWSFDEQVNSAYFSIPLSHLSGLHCNNLFRPRPLSTLHRATAMIVFHDWQRRAPSTGRILRLKKTHSPSTAMYAYSLCILFFFFFFSIPAH